MAKKHCECCGAPMVEYKHGISKGLARCIYRLAMAGGNQVPVKTLDLTNSQYVNFPKLKYWGLATNCTENDDDSGRGGIWTITEKGWAFVKGEISIPHFVILYRNVVKEFIGEELKIQDVSEGWWYRPDYVRESRPHTEMGATP
jgi:hypothetical protein